MDEDTTLNPTDPGTGGTTDSETPGTPTDTPTEPTPTEPTTPEEPTYKAVGMDVLEDMFLRFGMGLPGMLIGGDDASGGFAVRLIPAGGAAGQMLAKSSDDDFATEWQTVELDGIAPKGGLAGQSLVKVSDNDYDMQWKAPEGILPTGGTPEQVLIKAGEEDYVSHWISLEELGVSSIPPTAIFNANDGRFAVTNKVIEVIEQIKGAGMILPEINPVRTGYDFVGWFTTAGEDGEQVTTSTAVDWKEGKSFYAKWQIQTYNITLSNNYTGAPAGAQTTVSYGSQLSSVTPPTRDGYTFLGYYTSSAGGSMVIDQTGAPVGVWTSTNVSTVYAHWKRNDIAGDANLESLTWENLNNMTADATANPEDYTYLLGQTKQVTVAGYGTFEFMLVGIAHDDWADGSGKAAFTFMCTSCITTRGMNGSVSTTGGWGDSELRTWLNGTLLPALDADIADAIKPVKKQYTVSAEDRQSMMQSEDSLFLVSPMELFGTNEAGLEGSQYQYLAEKGEASHKLLLNGNPSSYYTRSVYDAGSFYSVDEAGALSHAESTSALGIAPCFCVGNLLGSADAAVAKLDSVWGQDEMWDVIDEIGDQVRLFPAKFDQFIGRDFTIQNSNVGPIKLMVVDVAHTDRTDGKGKAAFTLMTPDAVKTNSGTVERVSNNFEFDTYPWPKTDIDNVYNGLSSTVKSKITEVTLQYPRNFNEELNFIGTGGITLDLPDLTVENKKIWIPSMYELGSYWGQQYRQSNSFYTNIFYMQWENGGGDVRRACVPFKYYMDVPFPSTDLMTRDIFKVEYSWVSRILAYRQYDYRPVYGNGIDTSWTAGRLNLFICMCIG